MASFNSLPSLSTGAAPGPAGGIEAFDTELGFDESMMSVFIAAQSAVIVRVPEEANADVLDAE
jgi:hypothetical protein